jgi:hypothetical protein
MGLRCSCQHAEPAGDFPNMYINPFTTGMEKDDPYS